MDSTDHITVRFRLSARVRFTPPGARRETVGHVPFLLDLPVLRIAASEAPVAFRASANGTPHVRRAHGDLLLRPYPGGGAGRGEGAGAGYLVRAAANPGAASEFLGIDDRALQDVEIPAGSRIHEDSRPEIEAQAYLGASRLRLVDGALHVPGGVPALAFESGPTGVFSPKVHEGLCLPDAFGFAVDRQEQAAHFAIAHRYDRRDPDPDPFRYLAIEVAEGLATTFPEARCNARQAARLCLHAASQGIADLPSPFVALLARLAAMRDAVVAGNADPFATIELLNEIFEARPRKDRVVSLDNAVRLGCAAIAASLTYERGGTAALDPADAGALGALAV